MEVRRALAFVMILTGLLLAPFAALGAIDIDWEHNDRWDHHWDHNADHDWRIDFDDGHSIDIEYSGPLDD